MNDQLEQTLSKVIEKSLALAEQTGEFVIEQAPDLLQQFYMWHTTSSIFWVAFGSILILVGLLSTRIWGKKEKEYHSDFKLVGRYHDKEDGDDTGAIMAVNTITGLFGGAIILVNLYDLLYILVAPKLYLIEYFIH